MNISNHRPSREQRAAEPTLANDMLAVTPTEQVECPEITETVDAPTAEVLINDLPTQIRQYAWSQEEGPVSSPPVIDDDGRRSRIVLAVAGLVLAGGTALGYAASYTDHHDAPSASSLVPAGQHPEQTAPAPPPRQAPQQQAPQQQAPVPTFTPQPPQQVPMPASQAVADQQYLSTLISAGIGFPLGTAGVVAEGHQICERLGQGEPIRQLMGDIISGSTNSGPYRTLSVDQAQTLINAASASYCPQYTIGTQSDYPFPAPHGMPARPPIPPVNGPHPPIGQQVVGWFNTPEGAFTWHRA